jgi:YfiH family protein
MPRPPIYQTSQLLQEAGVSHAFFSRRGGSSGGSFASLNFSALTGDAEENVKKNCAIAADCLNLSAQRLYFLKQVHGTETVEVLGSEDPTEINQLEGDIVLASRPQVGAAIRTADCVPVLLACTASGLVAACHAGWQGCEKNAAGEAVRVLKARGAERLLAAIGPHISKAAFEVSDDVAARLLNASPDKEIVDRSGDKPHVNLRKMVRAQLLEAGLNDDDIDDVAGCTVLDEAEYFSFRRDGVESGRMLSVIVAGAPKRS